MPASRHDRPTRRPIPAAPPNLPSTAVARTSAKKNHISSPAIEPMLARRPASAKKMGRKNVIVICPSFSVISDTNSWSFGMTAPRMNAPNKACIPNHSVVQAAASTSRRISAVTSSDKTPRRFLRSTRNPSAGRTARTISTTNKAVPPIVTQTGNVFWPERTMAMTTARIHQAVTSSTAAHEMASAPIFVRNMSRSSRIRANTGKAVMLIAAHMNRVNAVSVTGGPDRRG